MSVRVNVRMSKIMRTLIKVAVRRYATYANYRTLRNLLSRVGDHRPKKFSRIVSGL